MAAHLFAAIDVGSFELEMGIYETTSRNGLREIDHLRGGDSRRRGER